MSNFDFPQPEGSTKFGPATNADRMASTDSRTTFS